MANGMVDDAMTKACAAVLGRHGVAPTVPAAVAQLVSAAVQHGPIFAARYGATVARKLPAAASTVGLAFVLCGFLLLCGFGG